MLNCMKTNDMNTRVFNKGGIELFSPDMSLRSLGNCFMLLSGLITLNALNPFTGTLGKLVISVKPDMTTKKSNQFQPSLKKEFACRNTPCVTNLSKNSAR